LIEVLVNDKFVANPNTLDEATRYQVGKYLVEHFLEMAYQEKPNDKKLTALSKYLHEYFPELFEQ
tara:strand:+ start:187 stop:381 length:195 start_codon:yes stop_codon:yes gene_type:complete